MEPQRTGVADDLDAEVAAIAAEISDAGSALEALRLVAQTVCELERSRQAEGHGGPQAAQLEAMSYLIHTAQQHVRRAGEASERAEAAAADGSVSPAAEQPARAASEMYAGGSSWQRLPADGVP